MLKAMADDMAEHQTDEDQEAKSKGQRPHHAPDITQYAESHVVDDLVAFTSSRLGGDLLVRHSEHSGEGGDGLGLGLNIVKILVDAHRGRIDLDSSPQGTTFTVTLPRCAAEDPQPEAKTT